MLPRKTARRPSSMLPQSRRAVAAVLLAGLTLGWPGVAAADEAPPGASRADVRGFAETLWPDAEREGVSRSTFEAAFAGLSLDPTVAAMTRRQPEEVKPVGAYLAAQVTPARVAAGRAQMARWGADLAAIERRYGVPRSILVSIWGLESGYGGAIGNKDVIRSLATLGALRVRPDLQRTELLAALKLLQDGAVRRQDLRGSWAGAMGLPQFMPSSFAAFAVDWNQDGRRDIWTTVPDALASIANFIRSQGWQPDRPWGFEVLLPPGFDFRTGRADYAAWAARGVERAGGGAMPAAGEGIFYSPAGAAGPALLLTPNFEVLKTYNFSDAYALSVGTLADRLDGRPAIAAPWPDAPPISRNDRIALQASLADHGYAVDNREGRISLALRDVIRSAQARLGLVPDGNPTVTLLKALQAAR